jgi:diacylglycerol kinase family enzyme
VETRYRGHATTLASGAGADGFELVVTLGGDGTVNEAVNGLLRADKPPDESLAQHDRLAGHDSLAQHDSVAGHENPAGHDGRLPGLAPLPGGNANVFARALGLPPDPVDAARQVVDAVRAHRCRSVGLGLADERYFAFNSGMGIDAEVVRAVEGRRAHGRSVSPALYLRMALRQFYRLTDRRHPSVTLEQSGGHRDGPLFWCTVSNTSPWTYLGRRPVRTNPQASFDSGLDVFGMRTLSTASTLRTLRQMMAPRTEPPHGRGLVARHDLAELTLEADRPVAFQIDGEYVGERERVTFRAVPHAIRVVM